MITTLLRFFQHQQAPSQPPINPEPIPGHFADADFIAIDFETATAKRDSACSIGMAACRNGSIMGTYKQLLKPPRNEYLPLNIGIHGIKPSDTRNAPTIADIHANGLGDLLEAEVPLVAHNASFDMSVLRESLAHHGIQTTWIAATCTVELARTMYPTLNNHKLNTVAKHIGYPLIHHDPISDAMAAAAIMFRWIEGPGAAFIKERNQARIKPYIFEHNKQFKELLQQAKALEKTDPKQAARTYMLCLNKMKDFDIYCRQNEADPCRPSMPINRLTLTMERAGLIKGCFEAFDWYSKYNDPVQLNGSDTEAVQKRKTRLEKRSGKSNPR
jgi:DNA polymerase-3 subunit epsilon